VVFVRTEGVNCASSFGFNKMYAITATATSTQTPIIIHVVLSGVEVGGFFILVCSYIFTNQIAI
jgi:hypothetical protein